MLLFVLSFSSAASQAATKDEWLVVRSKNFNLIGNASEKDIRAVAARLEQFREVFRQIFDKVNFNSPVPTTVVVFKDAASYNPYKPLKKDGQIDKAVAGYFLSADDANFITLSMEGDTNRAFETIFHEYTHFWVDNNIGKSNVPPWFNEGLAEYYQNLKIENEQKIVLGSRQDSHLELLAQNKLIPFDTFFNTDNYTLAQQADDGAGLFYAQAWALTHYLLNGNGGARSRQIYNFLDLVMSGRTAREAFSEAFQTDYATMEKELKKYIEQKNFVVSEINLKNKLAYDAEMQAKPLREAEAKTHLGELLFYLDRLAEAERNFLQVFLLSPNSSRANLFLGKIRAKQGKMDEFARFLAKAIEQNPNDFLTHYHYARVLSEQGMSEFGFVDGYPKEHADKMRESLKKAIALNPDFAQSYELYAFVSVVRKENLDEAIEYLNRALKIAPGNQQYLIRMAELLMWKEDFANARRIALKIARTASEPGLKIYAENTFIRINNYEGQMNSARNPRRRRQDDITDRILTEEELRVLREQGLIESLNMMVAKPQQGEKRILGSVTKVECQPQAVYFTVKSEDNNILRLKSETFETVNLTAYSREMGNARFGCGELKQQNLAVIVYRQADKGETKIAGELKSIEFVPANFRFLNR
ncbi:MAG: tetratricopeptide repeat protein [Acidobacteriota bacterium]|nr:tetratricopeptide repeat protein [Acidobacteriota bacterium]